jgi:GNAT superfamily N-acetyltransferase
MAEYEISTDKTRLDVELIHSFLAGTYWAAGIPRSVVEKAIANSLCFGIYVEGNQVGFARVITDLATFGYLADVFVIPEHRGRGLSKALMRHILSHPDMLGLRRILLATKDAHGLYEQFGFGPFKNPERLMSIHNPDVYGHKTE